eukprot:CAMPEP_0184686410 /NCGR_PEP_ID=MMETSP0312-20130426/22344_1 /TAXON_ID=31354 /ORGANISM="Compsopogon coeruleus, Strain SAG 36.94" /LENGTH=85 /DNA_ID=CAMNT_0027141463 /DNA_START=20 /DNA_END=274 /DNA_ORIENTATION=+
MARAYHQSFLKMVLDLPPGLTRHDAMKNRQPRLDIHTRARPQHIDEVVEAFRGRTDHRGVGLEQPNGDSLSVKAKDGHDDECRDT